MPLCHVADSVECVVRNLLGIHNICIQVCYECQFNNCLYKSAQECDVRV